MSMPVRLDKATLREFWMSRWASHAEDWEATDADFRCLSGALSRVLRRAGFTCSGEVATTPDWLLETVPLLGAKGLAVVRAAFPYYPGGAWELPPCPGQRLMRARWAGDEVTP